MTTYTFNPTTLTQSVDWNSPTIWAGGVVPNGPDADVVVPEILSNGSPYGYDINIDSGSAFSIRTLTANSSGFSISGSLDVSQAVVGDTGFELDGGTLTAGSIDITDGGFQGTGQIECAGSFGNNLNIVGDGLSITAGSFTNDGQLAAPSGNLTLTVAAGGFANIAGGILTGGMYEAGNSVNFVANLATLYLNVGQLPTVDAANIDIKSGGAINFFDPSTQQYVPIQSTLTTIAANGTLSLAANIDLVNQFKANEASINLPYTFGSLTDYGAIDLNGAILNAPNLTIAPGGQVNIQGTSKTTTINSSVVDNGTMGVFYTQDLVINGNVSGSSALQINGTFIDLHADQVSGGTLEINGVVSQNIVFEQGTGTLQLDQPGSFSGSISVASVLTANPTIDGRAPTTLNVILQGPSLASVTSYSYSGDSNSGTLAIQTSQGNYAINFVGDYQTTDFALTAGPQALSTLPPSLAVTLTTLAAAGPVCFCRGTRIATERGEVPVEDLLVGDRVRTLAGARKPVRWIGVGRDLVTRANRQARPIIVRTGALADNVPCRDLYLTHGHALYLDGVLIPVEHLVNHHSILWDETARVVEYYHVELQDHDVLLAEGAAAESYLDAGNRAHFQNMRPGSARRRKKAPCAPVVTGGEVVERVWARLFDRCGPANPTETTEDPDLHLMADGERIDPESSVDGVYAFTIERPAGSLRLRSRAAVPSLLGFNRHEHRRLGVALRQLVVQGAGVMMCLDHDAPLLRNGGCHLPDDGYSWTDGDLELPAGLFTHLGMPVALVVQTRKIAMRYPTAAAAEAAGIRRRGGGRG